MMFTLCIMQYTVTFHMCSEMIGKLFFLRSNIREKSGLILGFIDFIHQAICT